MFRAQLECGILLLNLWNIARFVNFTVAAFCFIRGNTLSL